MPHKINLTDRSGWSLDHRDPQVIQSLMPIWDWFYHIYFRVRTSGWHHVPPPGRVMFVGSHNGGLAAPDMFMMMYDWFRRFGLDRPIYGLMHPKVWQIAPPLADLAVQAGAVKAHPKMAIAALRRDAGILVYPGGARDVFRPYGMRHQICLAGNRTFIRIALEYEVTIVPVIASGAHETFLVLADLYQQMRQLHAWGMPWMLNIDPEVFPVYLGLPWGLAFGPLPHFPLPMQIHTHICPPITFQQYGRAAACDRAYVDACYNLVCTQMQQEMDALAQGQIKPELMD
ncbi:glycerol acyltransferase [Leptolyngbya sp. 'hensonii']|uniref:lysophospholipid acyltransferase family protein n=1 Tax=Leptolyngbya sp. 'hensonii' TaxID=1922337 RepID=UPI00094F55BB|nr:lysophospholipid acyltransferase family protein [Leptolyngbya sp. 'hensonii']OLP18954.1 glycerol acyltransferase [Leptolyngbya sp. 'hensonii']